MHDGIFFFLHCQLLVDLRSFLFIIIFILDQAFDAYVVGKEDSPGIVVLQEWWGVDFEIKNHAEKISQLGPGFKALIPE